MEGLATHTAISTGLDISITTHRRVSYSSIASLAYRLLFRLNL
jgi:hypothetical protein